MSCPILETKTHFDVAQFGGEVGGEIDILQWQNAATDCVLGRKTRNKLQRVRFRRCGFNDIMALKSNSRICLIY